MGVRRVLVVCAALALGVVLVLVPAPGRAVVLPPGVTESVAFSGLEAPVVFRFSPDGRVFVGEKTGVIKVFNGLGDTTPTVFADLRTNVFNGWDRGLLGLALDPNFPATPSVYVLYTHDAAIGGTAPRWGTVGGSWDDCPTPPGVNGDGCVVSGRLSRLTANGDVSTGAEQVLIEDWCQQFPSHSVGSIVFGADGALYASAGDGANYNYADYGQAGTPRNPCGDPPGGVGATLTPPTAEGGALRAQDVRTTGDPAGLDGTIIRVDATNGEPLPANPFAFSSDKNMRRIVAYGMRNPFRITVRPGTNDLWIGDVGWGSWEEINVTHGADTTADNFGWPCYEGVGRQDGYDAANLTLCESLYSTPGSFVPPIFAYSHSTTVVPGETCPSGGSSMAGMAFAPSTGVPDKYRNALFFADYSRDCIWAMRAGGDGSPDPALVETFAAQASNPVDLQFGPDGALYYVDVEGGAIRRIAFSSQGGDQTPPAAAITQPAAGATLTGSTTVAVTASDAGGVVGVRFLVDGVQLGTEDTAAPFQTTFDTTIVSNGTHTLSAVARDFAGNTGTASPIQVTVANAGGTSRYVSDLPLLSSTNGWGPIELDRSNAEQPAGDGGPLTIAGTTYAKGIGVHANSEIRVAVPSGCTGFVTDVGIDDEVGNNGSLRFRILADGVVVADSGVVTGAGGAVALTASVTGSAELRLLAQDGGNGIDFGHGDWANAHFTCGAGTGNSAPTALATATPTSGAAPLTVDFDGTGSTDPDQGDTLTYAWDLDDDGAYDDATGATARTTYTTPGTMTARLRVTDSAGASGLSAPVTVIVANAGGTSRYVSDLPLLSSTNGWGPIELDRSNAEQPAGDGGPLTIAGTTYAKGIGVHANSEIRVAVPSGCTGFVTDVGIDDEVGNNGSLRFRILADGVVVADSGVVTGAGGAVALTASVTGSAELRLLAQDSGNGIDFGHGDWANAHFTCGTTNTPPAPVIVTPDGSGNWSVGDVISFTGTATDAEDGQLPAAALTWTLAIEHCPSNTCHSHVARSWSQVAQGSFTTPDHEYPSHLELRLTATDSQGATTTTTVALQPKTVELSFQSVPTGLSLVVGAASGTTPFTRTVIAGSVNSVSADSPQTLSGRTYTFDSWSDGESATHQVVAPAGGATLSATFVLSNGNPTAVATATPTSGAAPLTVDFDGTGSTDPDQGDTLTYAWDLDGDGAYDDATGATARTTYTTPATITARLRVTDSAGNSATSGPISITAQNTAPQPLVSAPVAGTLWTAGETIAFSGSAQDGQDGALGPGNLDWALILHPCAVCTEQTLQQWMGTASGSFTAPDAPFPATLELRLTATDANGATDTVSRAVDPRTVTLSFATTPAGLSLDVGGIAATPFNRTATVGSTIQLAAPSPQTLGADTFDFTSWSDGEAPSHAIAVPGVATTYSAVFTARPRDTTPPTVALTTPAAGPVSGNQSVTATASDTGGSGVAGVQFKLDGTNLGSEDTAAPYALTWNTAQAANGQHTLTAVARDAAGNTTTSGPVVVTVQNGIVCPAGQWKAEYFNNVALSGSPAIVRCEQAIDNTWGSGAPAGTGLGADNFSVRWSGTFSFLGGSASFAATADDGIRVRVDGTLVIDQWRDQGASTFIAQRTVSAGTHDVSVEYYERGGAAVARVSWREGLVAAYSFEETTGSAVNDRSSSGNTGTITGATRTTSGHSGRALSFGSNGNWVTVPDANTLDLTNRLTLEAWVYPTALGTATRFVLGKEATGVLRYALYANTSSRRPAARVDVGGGRTTIGTAQLPLNTWSHLAATFDGSTLRLFVNGIQVSSVAASGSIAASTGALRIGGNAVASEWFRGRIDDVRIYSRALSAAELQADAAAPVP